MKRKQVEFIKEKSEKKQQRIRRKRKKGESQYAALMGKKCPSSIGVSKMHELEAKTELTIGKKNVEGGRRVELREKRKGKNRRKG